MNGTIIRVGDDTPKFSAFADFFDGEHAVVRRSTIEIEETGDGPVLVVSPPEMPSLNWPLKDLRTVSDQAGRDTLVLALKGDPVSRLIVSDAEARSILIARSPGLGKRPPVKGKARLFAWSAGAIASVALIILVLVPIMADQLAEYLPLEGERALGDKTFEQIRSVLSESDLLPVGICENEEGLAALGQMQARLEAGLNLPYPLRISVLDHGKINAFALPGGQIVLFRGLIDAAETPDEIAAVLAHEIGHVENRDAVRGALRSAGSIGVLGLLFGDFAGGTVVLFLANMLIDASYSQDAEAHADTFAYATLRDAGIPPSSLATFFERMRKMHGEAEGLIAHFETHPSLGNRIEAARAADAGMSAEIRPSLNEEQWRAFSNICN
ncbi:MAG: M48 family metallopeptidase [Paracoccaceae bacterium]